MAHTEDKDTPTPQVDEGSVAKAKPQSQKSAGKKSKPFSLQEAMQAKERLERKASRKSRATHAYKITVEPEVAETLATLSRVSGFSIRQLYRIAIAHLINEYAYHYGLQQWFAPEVTLPPPTLSSTIPQAAPMQSPYFPSGGYPTPGEPVTPPPYPQQVQPAQHVPQGYPLPQHVHEQPYIPNVPVQPSAYRPPTEINGIPFEAVPFKF